MVQLWDGVICTKAQTKCNTSTLTPTATSPAPSSLAGPLHRGVVLLKFRGDEVQMVFWSSSREVSDTVDEFWVFFSRNSEVVMQHKLLLRSFAHKFQSDSSMQMCASRHIMSQAIYILRRLLVGFVYIIEASMFAPLKGHLFFELQGSKISSMQHDHAFTIGMNCLTWAFKTFFFNRFQLLSWASHSIRPHLAFRGSTCQK